MKQAIMTSPGVIEYNEVPVPAVGDDQIKVRMKRIGVCGSDIHVNHGKHPYTSYPVVQGHEVSAQVVEIGKNVSADHEHGVKRAPRNKIPACPVPETRYHPDNNSGNRACNKQLAFFKAALFESFFELFDRRGG